MVLAAPIRARVAPELVAEARAGAGLPPDAPVSEVIRYGLALMAGKPDPLAIATRRVGESLAAVAAREAYRASLATRRPISRERLARRFGITERKARNIMAECLAAQAETAA